ncbi:MAG TPA: DUF488 domain-containing protein [Candidatus Microbacterium stercoravium]|uniref:DUF488 domain-containing protein n=1 Tax=Candidatus Microbacterium stercoravium TaxID=2838697 RepID=A0A9D2H3G4_9MICO|nr:DUF488 domain-containing protein [Candidatus Microbacterium stercoravium]
MTGPREIWTIGHWTHPVADFLELLHPRAIASLVDVRAHPGSRRSPQFGSDAMAAWLADDGIDYRRLAALSGRRPRQDADPSINAGWQNSSFKNYADYTLTDEYRRGVEELTAIAASRRTAIMCGEPVPWRCHRLLISNTLVVQGWAVHHVMPDGSVREHVLGQWGAPATLEGEYLTYPDEASD